MPLHPGSVQPLHQELCDTAEAVVASLCGCKSNSFSSCGVTGQVHKQSHGMSREECWGKLSELS